MEFNNHAGPIKYLADPHLGHANIIRYCARPFASAAEMDYFIWSNILAEDAAGTRLVFGGDMFFKTVPEIVALGGLAGASRHLLLFGNHDKYTGPTHRDIYHAYAATLVGQASTWRHHTAIINDVAFGRQVSVLLSHEPQCDLQGCAVNVYGHHHNNMTRYPEKFLPTYDWLFQSTVHANAGAELHNYKPVSLETLFPQGF